MPERVTTVAPLDYTNRGLHSMRRTIRATPNPMDKSTIVSIYPREIDEKKPTTQPGRFIIPPGSVKEPSILTVGTSSWWRDVDPEQPLLEIPHSSVTVAESIIRDWAVGLFQCDMGERMPGLFYVPGDLSLIDVLALENVEGENLIAVADRKQRNWFEALVKAGDTLWARTMGNPLSIDDNMRLAAQELKLDNKPWLADFTTLKLEACPACGQLRDSNFPVCQHCKTIVNKVQYDELGFIAAV